MKYVEFISILTKLGYVKNFYKAGDLYYHSWRFFNGDVEVIISYVIDESNKVRQQFINDEVVNLHIRPMGNSGNWEYLSYDKCIDNIIYNKYGNIQHLREYRLNQLGV